MSHRPSGAAGILFISLITFSACARETSSSPASVSFGTPEEAVAALVAAVEHKDLPGLMRLLGPGSEQIVSSGDSIADREAGQRFLASYQVRHRLLAGDDNDLVLSVGDDDWPLPIPLVRSDGRWHWDGAAGADELIVRRVGANELQTIDVMRGYVFAQDDYAVQGHDGLPSGIYAQALRSDSGKHNGLYWAVAPGQPQSPAGPLLAAAEAQGYAPAKGPVAPYHGYVYRMLFSQGPAAFGGSRDYLVDGELKGGYALIARPGEYGTSGIMTFIVNQDGIVWQKDLGERTAELAAAIQQFNPDSTWTPIPRERSP